MGRSPQLIPPLITPIVPIVPPLPEDQQARELFDRLHTDVWEAQDNLLKAKVSQAAYANGAHNADFKLDIGDRIMLSMKNR